MKKFGRLIGIRDENSLDFSISSVDAQIFGQELYPSVEEKAARLCFNLKMDHPFHDGNKRIGYYCLIATLELNGLRLNLSESKIIELILNLASHTLDYEDFLKIIKNHVVVNI